MDTSEQDKHESLTSPVKAIRAYCLQCVGGSFKDVRICTGDLCIGDEGTCPLHPFRFGRRPRAGVKATRSPVKAISLNCRWCSGDSAYERRLCPSVGCALHPFRKGRNPFVSEKCKEAARNAARLSPGKFKRVGYTSW
ncbi:MAG: hypothetical protein ABIK28_25135 [Planctomycetota bacterium]